jgi:hypothetical protein
MTTCLKYCTPIAAVMFLGVVCWQLVLPGRTFFGIVPVRDGYDALDEYWPAEEVAEAEGGEGDSSETIAQRPAERTVAAQAGEVASR